VKKILAVVANYIKDWKNLLAHTVGGFSLLAVTLFLPVAWYYRIFVFVTIVSLNTLRIRHAKMKREAARLPDNRRP
jgi:hypothetical protein